jgi:hypothetical protein
VPDKKAERRYLAHLRALLPDLPPGPARDHEPPDFCLGAGAATLGIELTVFHAPPAPGEREHHERHSLQKRVVTLAARLHREAGGPALYLTATFNPQRPLTKRTVPHVAAALARAVFAQAVSRPVRAPAVRIARAALPDEVPHVGVYGSLDGTDALWQAGNAAWVQPVPSAPVQAVIDDKMRGAPEARTRCERLWLVIVNDVGSGAAPAELTDEARHHHYTHAFDRVLWFEPHEPLIVDLPRPGPDV